ncbi:hypothetical protein ACFFIX_19380 [Metabacillus herbersteinensis]|uniref:DUF4760 domain-containing protein n=1 Tax=Metabacillus herbersteinensis TaxID=283816 RepID=A0ABV6GIN6_9BACI
MPEVKDWITYVLTAVSILVTAWFSFRVLKATEATNEVTKATLYLSKEIALREEMRKKEFNKIMRKQYILKILKESKLAHDALVDTDSRNIYNNLKNAPKSLSVDIQELASYFEYEEIEKIKRAWNTYSYYLDNYYKEEGYSGNGMNLLPTHAGSVISEFHFLMEYLKNLSTD